METEFTLSARGWSDEPDDLPDDFVRALREHNRLDQRLYQYAQQLFAQRSTVWPRSGAQRQQPYLKSVPSLDFGATKLKLRGDDKAF